MEMLRSLSVILLIAALITQSCNWWVIQLEYYANTASFEKNCENKTRPAMQCHGKCQMFKKLKSEEKNDQQNPERKTSRQSEVISSKSFFTSYTIYQSAGTGDLYAFYDPRLPVVAPRGIFHPPSA